MNAPSAQMLKQSSHVLKQRNSLEKHHVLASGTYVSSPCGKFKLKCRITSLSYTDYEISLLYHNQTMGERYKIGQEITLYHDKEKWEKTISVVSGKGNLIEAEIVNPETMIVDVADNGTKTFHSCELLGYYSNLYRVHFENFDKLNGSLFLHLPNGENYPIRLRWREKEEICFQAQQTTRRVL